MRVDTKAAGFVMLDVPMNTPVAVGGTVTRDGSETTIQASGVRY